MTTDEDGPPVAAIAPPARGVPIAAVADRAPAGAVPTAVAMPVGQRTYNGMPPALFHVPDLPDAVQAWNGLRPMMALWMAFSVGMVGRATRTPGRAGLRKPRPPALSRSSSST